MPTLQPPESTNATLPPHPCLGVLLRLDPTQIIEYPSTPLAGSLLSFVDKATAKSLRVGDAFGYSTGVRQGGAQPPTQAQVRVDDGDEEEAVESFPDQDQVGAAKPAASSSSSDDDDDESETQSIAEPSDLPPSKVSSASLNRQSSVTRRSPTVNKPNWVSKNTSKTSAFDDLTMRSISRPNKKKRGAVAASSRPSSRNRRKFGKGGLRSDSDSSSDSDSDCDSPEKSPPSGRKPPAARPGRRRSAQARAASTAPPSAKRRKDDEHFTGDSSSDDEDNGRREGRLSGFGYQPLFTTSEGVASPPSSRQRKKGASPTEGESKKRKASPRRKNKKKKPASHPKPQTHKFTPLAIVATSKMKQTKLGFPKSPPPR